LAFEKIFEEVMLKQRRSELDLYKLLAKDDAFKVAMQQSLRQVGSIRNNMGHAPKNWGPTEDTGQKACTYILYRYHTTFGCVSHIFDFNFSASKIVGYSRDDFSEIFREFQSFNRKLFSRTFFIKEML
jgi:hypothetical protein